MSLEVISGVMLLKLRFELLSLRLLLRSTVSNPLVIDNLKSLQEAGSNCKIMKTYQDFVSLQANPSASQAIGCANLPEFYNSISVTDSSLQEVTKNILNDFRWRTVPSIFVNKYGHLNKKQYQTSLHQIETSMVNTVVRTNKNK